MEFGACQADGFYVEDDGSGIPKEIRDEIFDPGHSTSDVGTGIGLAIVKQSTEAHGWNIALTESSDDGDRFEGSNIMVE